MALKDILINFLKHIEENESKNGEGYSLEFQKLKDASAEYEHLVCESGETDINRFKNRYRDILPYDQSRVSLTEIDGLAESDYINASFIQNANSKLAYIAAQAPLLHTLADFWRMIHQYKVQLIIMACNEKETGRQKCERYWPYENEERHFGKIVVTVESISQVNPSFLVRTLIMKAADETRKVFQFHYTGWPDHGIPHSVKPLLEMIRLVREYQPSETIPIVVHCSAGCGRTGTICAIDYSWSLLRFGKLNADFSIFNILLKMRQQRKAMVQTKDQYILVHRAVAELFQEQLTLIENNLYENVETIKSADNRTSSCTEYLQRLYDTEDTGHDYANVCPDEPISLSPKIASNKVPDNLIPIKCTTISPPVNMLRHKSFNLFTNTTDSNNSDSTSCQRKTVVCNHFKNLDNLDANTIQLPVQQSNCSPNETPKSTVSDLKNIFDSPANDCNEQSIVCAKRTLDRKSNIENLRHMFDDKQSFKISSKTDIVCLPDKIEEKQNGKVSNNDALKYSQESSDVNSNTADYEDSDSETPENYKNLTLKAQKNIDQITKTVEKHPRGAIIDLTSTSHHEVLKEPYYESVSELQDKCNSNFNDKNSSLSENKKSNMSPLQKFPANLKSFLSNHNTQPCNDGKDKSPTNTKSDCSTVSHGIFSFKHRKNNSVDNNDKKIATSPKTVTQSKIFSFSNPIKLNNTKDSPPPVSPKPDLSAQIGSKDTLSRPKFPEILSPQRNDFALINSHDNLVNEIQAKINTQLKISSKNQETDLANGEDFKDSSTKPLAQGICKNENVKLVKPPRKPVHENVLYTELEENLDKYKPSPPKRSMEDNMSCNKNNDKFEATEAYSYSYVTSVNLKEAEHNNNNLYAEVNIVKKADDPLVLVDNVAYDSFEDDNKSDRPPSIPEKLPGAFKLLSSGNNNFEDLPSRPKLNLNPIGFFQKVAKKAEGVFSCSPVDSAPSTSEVLKLETDNPRTPPPIQAHSWCFPHRVPKKPKGPRIIPDGWKVP